MKKTVVVVTLMFAILLSACSQIPGLGPAPVTGPTVDTAAMTSAFQTAVVQSLTAQPTSTLVSATDTPTVPVAVESPTLPPDTDTPTVISIDASVLNLTTTPATATGGPANTAGTATLGPVQITATATLATGQPSPIWTLGVRTYGTLPPAVPFSKITLINKAKAEAYISLHVDLANGSNTVIEYPVEGVRTIRAPIGPYRYVAWVGGNKMIGSFRLTSSNDITITLYKDRIVIK